ncbi:MAG: aminotransferase class I/II-fold pyridoxal phosphate-dependent enzyme [Rhodospirillales bacterium]|nr:MAG: aminotransferase class I/II-fold pyridoxal phosphate-dependent enzyme [Rhodospirillales bacterium]
MRDHPGLDLLGDYPFQRLAALLKDIPAAEGMAPILMHIGEPQLPQPAMVAEAVARESHLWNRYPPVEGTSDFRAAAAAWLTRRYGLPDGMVDPERHVIAACGTREVLFQTALVAVPDRDGGTGAGPPVVLMPNPMYHVYYGATVLAGAEPVLVPATAESGFMPDYAALDPNLLRRTALAYLCSPGNPQGAVASLERLQTLIELAREHGFLLALDECYSEIWRGSPPPGGLEACAALGGEMEGVLVFHSLSKRSNAAGLRAGFVAGDAAALARLLRLRNYGGAPIPGPLQAAAAALWRDEDHVVRSRAHYQALFELARRILGNRAGYHDSPGGFFLWLDVGDGEAAARAAWRHGAVKVMPGGYMSRPDSATGANPGDRYIRIALVHDLDTAEAGLSRLADALER